MPTIIEQNDFPLNTQLIYKGVTLAEFVDGARKANCLIFYAPSNALSGLHYRAHTPDGSLYGSWFNTGFSTLWVRKEGGL